MAPRISLAQVGTCNPLIEEVIDERAHQSEAA